MSAVTTLWRGVEAALARAGVPVAAPLVAACSHGPDSLALADALLALRLGRVTLVYVDHGLRPEAAAEAERVRAYAASRGAAAVIVRARVERGGEGLEAAARAARYAALDRAADDLGVRFIALGHTASDQAETVLARLLRGAGPVGLAGIPPARGRYVRPLLAFDRGAVAAYLAARGLVPSHDAMNDDPAFLRVRVRLQHLPALRRENPALDAALARAAAALRETAAALDWAADRALADVRARIDAGEARVDAPRLAALPAAVAKRLLSRLVRTIHAPPEPGGPGGRGESTGGDALERPTADARPADAPPIGRQANEAFESSPGGPLEARHLDALLALAAGPAAGTRRLDLPRLKARREYNDLVLSRSPPAWPERDVHVADLGPADGPYLVRRWQPGDRMRPASLRGRSRKLQDLFTDRKIPAPARRQALVVVRERDQEIVWAEHVGAAFSARVQVSLTPVDPTVIYD